MAFKTDISFLQKISIGAVGTRRVIEHLKEQGYNPIELERGSTSFKIWKEIKIKRIRVPDILCIDCGVRVESRAKTKLQISMSHSFSDPSRGWDNGLEDKDYIAFIACQRSGERPIDWQAEDLVQYVSVKEMRKAYQREDVLGMQPKGAREGYEARLTWPAAIASANGVVSKVSEEHIQFKRDKDGRTITLQRTRKNIDLEPLVKEGDVIVENQILGAVVPVERCLDVPKDVTAKDYIQMLKSSALSKRYAACKALPYFDNYNVLESLSKKVTDSEEHIYVRLESAASLAKLNDSRGFNFIDECLSSSYLENQLEAVIVLGEISTEESLNKLISVLLNNDYHTEIRAGAAWALGEVQDKNAINALIRSFNEVSEEIRVEAARALAKIADNSTSNLLNKFPKSAEEERQGIAWALSKGGKLSVKETLDVLVDDNARRWVAYMIGMQDKRKHLSEIEMLKEQDPEVYFAVTVLWQLLSSWIYNLKEY